MARIVAMGSGCVGMRQRKCAQLASIAFGKYFRHKIRVAKTARYYGNKMPNMIGAKRVREQVA
jgi:hypothetical protein